MQEALYWGLRLFVDKMTLKKSSFSNQSFCLFSEDCTEVFPLSCLSTKNLHKHDYAVWPSLFLSEKYTFAPGIQELKLHTD